MTGKVLLNKVEFNQTIFVNHFTYQIECHMCELCISVNMSMIRTYFNVKKMALFL